MPSRGQSITVSFVAWDTSANVGKAGDLGNFTLRWVKDGTAAAPTNAPAEVDATNAPGVYKLALTAAECTCDIGTLAGKSSTAGVALIPLTIAFEQLPTAAPGATNGLPQVGVAPLTNLDAAVSSRLAPTTAGRTLDVSAGGEAGLDWANVGAPTTVVSLSGTTVGTVTSLTNAATVNAINGLAPPTNWNLTSLDGAGRVLLQPAQAGVTIPTVTAVTNAVVLPSIPANWIAAGGIATGALNGKGDWLTTLGGTAPVGWINAAAFVSGAVDASVFAQTAADKVWGTASRTLTAFGFTVSVSPVTLAANQPNYAPAVAGDAMNLTTVERSAVGTAVWASGSRTLTDKTGFGMAPNGVDTVIIETGFNLRQAMSLVCAVNMGNISGQNTNHPIVRAMGNDAVRIDAQADADGNRSDIILTPPL